MDTSTTSQDFLPHERFLKVVESTPLVSIDLVVLNEGKVLLGERLNRPAQGFWFVPGGRVRKFESLDQAYQRISLSELGKVLFYAQSQLLGVYEHFYSDSVFGETPGTHYVAIGQFVELSEPLKSLPKDQHGNFAWWSLQRAMEAHDVHPYTKDYLRSLVE
nr:GDP-mannose mannosyl hydrolase [Kushneria aurantia]